MSLRGGTRAVHGPGSDRNRCQHGQESGEQQHARSDHGGVVLVETSLQPML
jgi:hypothetical protein